MFAGLFLWCKTGLALRKKRRKVFTKLLTRGKQLQMQEEQCMFNEQARQEPRSPVHQTGPVLDGTRLREIARECRVPAVSIPEELRSAMAEQGIRAHYNG